MYSKIQIEHFFMRLAFNFGFWLQPWTASGGATYTHTHRTHTLDSKCICQIQNVVELKPAARRSIDSVANAFYSLAFNWVI